MNKDVLIDLGAKIYNEHNEDILGICYNYTTANKNYTFIEFKNNLKYLQGAIKKGICTLVTSSPQDIPCNIMQIIHSNPTQLMEKYIEKIRKLFNFNIIVVCGTAGKSSMKHFLSQCLSDVIVSNRSCNQFNLLVFFFLLLKKTHKYIILEVAQTYHHVDTCKQFTNTLRLFTKLVIDLLIVTNINYEHMLDETPVTLCSTLTENYHRVYRLIVISKKVVCNSHIYVGINSFNEYMCTNFTKKKQQLYCSILDTTYSVTNACTSLYFNFKTLCLSLYALSVYSIKQHLYSLCFRGSVIKLHNGTRITDFSFNALPISILTNINSINKSSIFILGDIYQLGYLKDAFVKQIFLILRHNNYIKKVYLAGVMFKEFIDYKKFFPIEISNLPKHKNIYIQGSRSSQMQNYTFAYINLSFGFTYKDYIKLP